MRYCGVRRAAKWAGKALKVLSGLLALALALQAWALIGSLRAKRWLGCLVLLAAGAAFALNGADLGPRRLDHQLFGGGCFAAGPAWPSQVPAALR